MCGVAAMTDNAVPGRSAMRVAASLGIEPHLNDEENKQGAHDDDARKRRVVIGEEVGETRISQANKDGRKQLDVLISQKPPRGGRYQLTCTKAVAISTPVPKCLQAKKTFGGILSHLSFFAATGKPQPDSC
jgi:hypothetical protein